MFNLLKWWKKEDKSGSGTPSGDDPISSMFCYKIDSEAEDKMSPLHRASWHGDFENVKTLLQKKPMDVDAVDSFDRTPLHLAVAKGFYNTTWVLLNHNASLDYVDCDGYTPFLKAVECDQKTCVHLILERGADVTCTDTNKNSALHLAAKQGSFTIISMLLKKGININAQNDAGESVLHVACAAENRDLVEFMLDNGSLINMADKRGRTPLMVVAKLGNLSIVDLLLDRGSQLDACDINCLSAKDYAAKEGHSKVAKQISMHTISMTARAGSKEKVFDDLDQNDENSDNSNNQKIVDAQIIELKKEDIITKSNVEYNQNKKKYVAFNSTVANDKYLKETIKILEEQLDLLDAKYTETFNRFQTLELSSTNLYKENQYLRKINKELWDKINNECTSNSTQKSVEIITQLESGNLIDQTDDMCAIDSKTIIKQLQEQLKLEQDRRIELDERSRLLSVEVSAHQSCSSTKELLKELQFKITQDYVLKKELLKLKTEQERKISKMKMEAEKKLADKFCDLDKLLSQHMDQKLEMQRAKIESQLKQEFENTRQRFQLEISKLQTTLKTKEMEEQILRERCEILSQEIEKTQDNKWKTLVDKTSVINDLQESTPDMLSMLCKTPEPSPTFERKKLKDISRYQNNVPTPENELDKVITQNKNAALEDDTLIDNMTLFKGKC